MSQFRSIDNIVLRVAFITSVSVILYTSYFPGLLNADSLDMLHQGMTETYHDWHSPLLAWTMGGLSQLYAGPALTLLLLQAISIICLAILLLDAWDSALGWTLSCLFILFYPPIFNLLGGVNKDHAFIAFLLLLHVCLLFFLNNRTWPIAITIFVIATIITMIRRDAVVAVAASVSIPLYLLLSRCKATEKRALLWTIFSIGLFIVSSLAIGSFINRYAFDAKNRFPLQPTLLCDLVGVSVQLDELKIPDYAMNPNKVTMRDLRQRYNPGKCETILFEQPSVNFSYSSEDYKALERAWMQALLEHPFEYLQHRIGLAKALLGLASPQPQLPYWFHSDSRQFYGVSLIDINADFNQGTLVRWYDKISESLVNTFVFRGLFYVVGLGVLIFIFYSFEGGPGWGQKKLLLLALCISGLLQAMTMLVFASTAVFRYLYWPVLCFGIGLSYAIPMLYTHWIRKQTT